jgi:glycosyltransferase involved in cell wall biosynthesis
MREQAVVFMGNFRHSPNVSAALWLLRDIWPRIRREVPDAQLYIVGGYPDVRMKEFDRTNHVTMTGWVDDVRPYLAKATLVLAPVFEGAGMRTKVLEAWAMEKPVVGTRLAFEGLTNGTAEFGFMADNADDFAQRVCALLRDSGFANTMGQRAREFVKSQFSWEAFATFYEKIYEEILGEIQPIRRGESKKFDEVNVESQGAVREQ